MSSTFASSTPDVADPASRRGADATAESTRQSRRAQVVAALAAIVPRHALLSRNEDVVPYECDGLTAYREQPLVVVLPETEEQIAQILAACHRLDVPVVARGAGTGLSGGALPHRLGVTLSLAKFNHILRIDPRARTATVQCGVRNLAISEAAAAFGLYYAPDPSSQIACTIGGNVAENSGGVHCLKYGLTTHNVLRARGYTVEGEPVEFGSNALDAAGLDLMSVLVGSEGMLAIVTEVTVKLCPKPQLARCIMASFDDIEKAGDAVAGVIGAGIIPAGLEMMDKPMTAAVEDFVHAGYDLDAAAILLCESDGTPEEVDEEIARMVAVLRQCGATRIEVSADEAQRLRFWSGRKNAFPASGRISPDYMCMDSTIPRKRLADILRAIADMETKYALRCANVFHAGDGNLHPLILFDANDPDQLHRAELFGNDILETSVAMGGSVTGEHGVGVEKLNSMCVQFSPEEREQMLSLKAAFDPRGLLNPGKAIPSLARCAEYGRMHVRRGLLPFPDLERFLMDALEAATGLRDEPALETLVERVRDAAARAAPLCIRGGGSKDFYGETPQGEPLSTLELAGISSYEPTELVVTARAGTRIGELEAALAEHRQYLPFDPPQFRHFTADRQGATVGGMVAAGLSGPARASVGAVRDYLLGATLLNGRAEVLSFGGQVMKNVAGYDVSRLLAGSMGTLGVILDVSLKVLPKPLASVTLRFDLNELMAMDKLHEWGRLPLPLNASVWWEGALAIRLSGARAAVASARQKLGGEIIPAEFADAFWAGLRDHRDEFFSSAHRALVESEGSALWRLSVPQTAPPLRLSGQQLIEWGGAQRWVCTTTPAEQIRDVAAAVGGHATLFAADAAGTAKAAGVFTPLKTPLDRIHRELKRSFDPQRLFNPGRLYPDL